MEMKKNGREKRAEISLALFMFLVFCLFISAFDSSQPRDVDKMSGPPAFYLLAYIFSSFFPFAFPFIISSQSLLLFLLFYATLFYYFLYIFLHVCFT